MRKRSLKYIPLEEPPISDPVSPLAAAGQVLSLTSALAKLIEQSEASDKNSESLAEILAHLRGESILNHSGAVGTTSWFV